MQESQLGTPTHMEKRSETVRNYTRECDCPSTAHPTTSVPSVVYQVFEEY